MTVTFRMEDEGNVTSFLLESLQLSVTMEVFSILADLLQISRSPSCGRIEAGELWSKAAQAMSELKHQGQEWTKSAEPALEMEEGSSMRVMETPALELEPLMLCVNRLIVIAHGATQKRTGVRWS